MSNQLDLSKISLKDVKERVLAHEADLSRRVRILAEETGPRVQAEITQLNRELVKHTAALEVLAAVEKELDGEATMKRFAKKAPNKGVTPKPSVIAE